MKGLTNILIRATLGIGAAALSYYYESHLEAQATQAMGGIHSDDDRRRKRAFFFGGAVVLILWLAIKIFAKRRKS